MMSNIPSQRSEKDSLYENVCSHFRKVQVYYDKEEGVCHTKEHRVIAFEYHSSLPEQILVPISLRSVHDHMPPKFILKYKGQKFIINDEFIFDTHAEMATFVKENTLA